MSSEGASLSSSGGKASDVATLDAAVGEEPAPESSRARGIAAGSRLGRYMVLEVLGQGGMGIVYAAFDPQLDRRVALKVLRAGQEAARRPRHLQRLLREAQAMARLSHPNVIAVHDVGTIDDEVFLAMEFVDGPTLTEWVSGATRTWMEIRDTYLQAGRGLAAAHAAGLVHRDFKPDNVLVDAQGRARVLDFGLARVDDTQSSDLLSSGGSASESVSAGTPLALNLTQVGARIGTPGYMAPEQHLGEGADALSDQFSFCVALFEALFGRAPFAGLSLNELSANVLAGKVRAPPRDSPVPGRIRRAVLRGLSRRPEHRFANMEALLDELAYDPGRRRRLALLGVGAATLAGAAAFAGASSVDTPAGADCSTAGQPLREHLDDSRREALAAAFDASGSTVGAYVWQRVEVRLDDYMDRYATVAEDVCVARNRGDRDLETLARQERCLNVVVAGVEAQLAVFDRVDADLVDRANAAVGSLQRPEDCADLELLQAEQALPDDPEVRSAVEEALRRLAKLRALEHAARCPEAIGLGEALLAEVEPLGWAPLTIDVTGTLGTCLGHELRTAEALQMLRRAAVLAGEADDERRRAGAWLEYLVHLSHAPGRQHEALALAEVVETLSPNPARRLILANVRGSARLILGEYEAARDIFHEALELGGSDAEARSYVRNNYAVTLLHLGQYSEARKAFDEQLGSAREIFGEGDHPDVVEYLVNIAITHRYQGNIDRADEVADDAEAMRERVGRRMAIQGTLHMLRADAAIARGELDEAEEAIRTARQWAGEHDDPVQALSTQLAEGELLGRRGDFVRARAVLQAARDGFAQLTGDDSLGVALAEVNRADVERMAGDRQAALAQFETAIPRLEAATHDRHPHLVQFLASFGHELAAAGQLERAERTLRRAISIGEHAGMAAPMLARPRFDLAKLTGGDEAQALVARATIDADRAIPHDPELPAEIEAWIAKQ